MTESPTAAAARLVPAGITSRDRLAIDRWITWAESKQLTALQAVQPDSLREYERWRVSASLPRITPRTPAGSKSNGSSSNDTYRVRTLIGRPMGVRYHGDGRQEKPKKPTQKPSNRKCPCGEPVTASGQCSCDVCRAAQRLRPSPETKALRAAVNIHTASLVAQTLGLQPVEVWLRVCNRHPTAMSEANRCRELTKVDRAQWGALRAEDFIFRSADITEAA